MTATADVILAEPLGVLRRLCAHFAEHGRVRVDGACGRIETTFGNASLEACGQCLKLRAEGHDETSLAFVKLSLAEHLLHFAAGDAPRIEWQGDGQAGAPLPYFREMTVASVRDLTPRMRRVTLTGADLARFAVGGHHVRLLFPKDDTPAWPVMGPDGRPQWPRGAARPDARVYTIRRIDAAAGEIDIDFVLHEGACPGGDFARWATPGRRVGMTGPGGGETPRADWLLLAGDETALPAIARMLEELPPTATAVVRIEVDGAAEEQPLASRASLDLRWLHRNGNAPGTSALLSEVVRAVEIPTVPSRFVWVGCEHRGFRSIRAWLRKECRLSRDEHLAVAYWRRGREGDEARGDDH
ncbi:MAG: siderophore-interacting protein [Rhizobiaceae bacterium]|nr:siderophore-interacting protein [Rhizobiaceae bacterium]MCV0407037.1 siderophore-interacting protein [Rhizobiaceae bacterium]